VQCIYSKIILQRRYWHENRLGLILQCHIDLEVGPWALPCCPSWKMAPHTVSHDYHCVCSTPVTKPSPIPLPTQTHTKIKEKMNLHFFPIVKSLFWTEQCLNYPRFKYNSIKMFYWPLSTSLHSAMMCAWMSWLMLFRASTMPEGEASTGF
jgi:hypothetical protein